MKSKYSFRFIQKSTWGISIDVIAEAIQFSIGNEPLMHIKNNLFCKINTTILLPDEKKIIYNAILYCTNFFEVNKETIIVIHEVLFTDTHYQFEGLFPAIVGWCSMNFEFELPKFEIHYDKMSNRYIFNLPS